MITLAGDIGGTKTILRITNYSNEIASILKEKTFNSKSYSTFYELLNEFLDMTELPLSAPINACFAVAGPCINGESKITNLPWIIEEHNFNFIKLVNDFYAIGYALKGLQSKNIMTLQTGARADNSPKVVMGAGTGFGMCIVLSIHGRTIVLPSEFGNTDFAPGDQESSDLLVHLLKCQKNVVYDNILSGNGLVNIYEYMQQMQDPHGRSLLSISADQDFPALISQAALTGEDPIAQRSLNQFIKIYAHTARNIALTAMSLGGLYLAGGIAPKIFNQQSIKLFVSTFLEKQKMQHILHAVPIYLIHNTQTGLLGANEIAKYGGNY